jgi:hypothetical protein
LGKGWEVTVDSALREGGGAGIRPLVRLLALTALIFSGCSSMPKMTLPWNSRAAEQAKMNEVTKAKKSRAEMTFEERLDDRDEQLEFDPSAANFGSKQAFGTRAARTGGFHFQDRVRTREFGTDGFSTKDAWMSGKTYGTKAAPVKESWFSKLTARTKTYGTREARDAGKAASVRALPDGERPFLVQGRTQAALDASGREQVPMGVNDIGPSYTGDLKPLTVEDVKKLLNKGQ